MANKRLVLCEMTIREKKEGALNRADISYIGARYTPGSSDYVYMERRVFCQLPKRKLGKQIELEIPITGKYQPLKPGEVIALVLFEQDPRRRKFWKPWKFDKKLPPLEYESKEEAYGFAYLKYDDFAANPIKTYDFSSASIKIKSSDG